MGVLKKIRGAGWGVLKKIVGVGVVCGRVGVLKKLGGGG